MSRLYSNALNPSSHSYDVGPAIHAMNTPLHEYIYIYIIQYVEDIWNNGLYR